MGHSQHELVVYVSTGTKAYTQKQKHTEKARDGKENNGKEKKWKME